MKKRLILLAGLGVGYVLGSRTGRQSYEKLKAQAQDLWTDPRVQDTVGRANQTIRDKAPGVADAVQNATDKVSSTAGTVASAAKGEDTSSNGPAGQGSDDVVPNSDPRKAADVLGDPERNLDDEGPAGVTNDD